MPGRRLVSRRSPVVALVIILVSLVSACGVPGVSLQSALPPPEQTAKVQRATIRTTIGASGVVSPLQEVQLSMNSGSTVKTVNVAIGQRVKANDVLGTVIRATSSWRCSSSSQTLRARRRNMTRSPPAPPRRISTWRRRTSIRRGRSMTRPRRSIQRIFRSRGQTSIRQSPATTPRCSARRPHRTSRTRRHRYDPRRQSSMRCARGHSRRTSSPHRAKSSRGSRTSIK